MNDDLWVETTGAYHSGYYLPIMEASTYVLLGLMLVRNMHIAGIVYAGIVTNLLFSVGLKSFVIGRGVMQRQALSTSIVKLSNLIAVGALFCLLIIVLRLLPFVHLV
jgi:hypothetical protein